MIKTTLEFLGVAHGDRVPRQISPCPQGEGPGVRVIPWLPFIAALPFPSQIVNQPLTVDPLNYQDFCFLCYFCHNRPVPSHNAKLPRKIQLKPGPLPSMSPVESESPMFH